MFGFVRPAACRSSAPRSVTDGCPYPPLPCRAKNRNKIQLFSHRKQEINGNDGNFFHRLRLLLPPLRRSPSLKEGGLGAARALSKILIQLRVQGRNPARFKGGYGVPRGFKGEKSKSPPNPLGLAERVPRPQAVEGVSSRRKAYSFPKLKYMRQNAEPCAGLRRILLILYLIRRGQSMSLPFSGGNIRPEHKKFNKSNSPLSPPLTALKFLNIPALFFRNSLDFAACHRLQ